MDRPNLLRVALGTSLPVDGLASLVDARLNLALSARRDLIGKVIDPRPLELQHTPQGIFAVCHLPQQVQKTFLNSDGKVVRGSTLVQDIEIAAATVDEVVRVSSEFHREVARIVAIGKDPQAELSQLEQEVGVTAFSSLKALKQPGKPITVETQLGTYEFERPASRKQYLHPQSLSASARVHRWPDANKGVVMSLDRLMAPHEFALDLTFAKQIRGYYHPGNQRILLAAALAATLDLPLEIEAQVNISVTTRRPSSLVITSVRNWESLHTAAGQEGAIPDGAAPAKGQKDFRKGTGLFESEA